MILRLSLELPEDLAYIKITRQSASEYELPFGVFLGIGGMLAITIGGPMVEWYTANL